MNELKIRSEGMLGTSHSWAVTMRNILSKFQEKGHKLYLKSINGNSLIPEKLKSRLDRDIKIPDLDICYTIPKNFQARFQKKSKYKMAIYNYETSILPESWKGNIKYVDYVLPSSQFSKQVFVNSGWPESKCIVVPHGINANDFITEEKYKLQNSRTFRFLNISIPHRRKNIDLLIDAYFSTFSNQDDVCLVLKTSFDKPKYSFEIDVKSIIISLQKKHAGKSGGLPLIEIITEKLSNMAPLYKSCDVLVSASSSEGFGLPLLEALAAGNIVIAPRCTGQMDFLNDLNSLLVDVFEAEAPPDSQYWIPTKGAKTYYPKLDSLSDQMLKAYRNSSDLKIHFKNETNSVVERFTWENAANKILEIK